ncbi:transposase DDE domain protein [Escherichia coli 3-475-03_S1_C1]|nr:transposase DDE domain protein [Escherichia coli 3-475-03_S1_C1]
MSHQLTFADSEFSTKRRQTRKEIFLSRMEQILPWQNMTAVIEPFYPKAGNGRRPYPLETMLRIHCMQHWYNLSDGAMEDALYEIASMRLFARLSLDSALPDRTTIMNFRHLLEQHQLARQLFKTINRWLAEAGVMMTQGTLVDATIIEAPSSTKNKEQQRDPEMHQTKKGNQWHFGMKAHIGVDAKSGLTHSLVTTAANEHDLNQLGNLLHGEEQFVSADAGYQGAPQREELAEVDVDWLIAERPGKVKTLKQNPRKNKTAINIEYMKASIRARVEHPFRIIKRQFGFVKARYRGSGRTATTGEVFLVRAVSRGISQPLTHRLSLRAEALIHSVHVLYRNGHRGSWRVTADFTHQRSCICTLIQNASQRSVTGEIYSLRLFWQILYVTL